MKKMTQGITPTLLSAASLLLCSAFTHASENGSTVTPMGVYDFGSGFMPPASDIGTFGLRAAYFSADKRKNGDSNETSGEDFSIGVKSYSAAYIKMTDIDFLGGKYGYSAIIPFLNLDASFTKTVPGAGVVVDQSGEVFRLGDALITPLIVQWTLAPNVAMNAQLAIQAPTGDYDKDRFVSSGLNQWVVSPNFAFSYISQTGFELSSNFQIDISTKNEDSDYKNGAAYRHEFALGQHLGPWTIGLGGYFHKQLTDDKTYSGYTGQAITDGHKGEVTALGPAVSFMSPGMPLFTFHAYKEFEAVNRPEGYNLALRVASSF